MSVRVTVFDGAQSIGGNKIYLEVDGRGLFLDFGLNFSRWSDYFDEFLRPRSGLGILDYLATGLIPPIPGLYRKELEPPGMDIWQKYRKPGDIRANIEPLAILTSHAHSDHIQLVSFLRPDIPIYSSLGTAVIAKARQDTSQSSPESETTATIPKEEYEGLLRSVNYRKSPARSREYIICDRHSIGEEVQSFWARAASSRELDSVPLKSWNVGPQRSLNSNPGTGQNVGQIAGLRVRFFPVDHSIPGAGAWAVETSEGWVVYTGDFRMHGARKSLTRHFITEAAKLAPLALICEGTHPELDWPMSEHAVYENAKLAVELSRGIVLADFSASNVERLETFRRIAEDTGRILVITPKDAYLLEALSQFEQGTPDPFSDTRIRVYGSNKVNLLSWERMLTERYGKRIITAGEISRSPMDFILCFGYYDLANLIDMQLEGGGYIRSSSEPFQEEMVLDVKRVQSWLERYQIRNMGGAFRGKSRGAKGELVSPFHASGHVHGSGLMDMIEEIRPRYLVPVHTENPRKIRQMVAHRMGNNVRVILPIQGQAVEFSR